MSAADRRSPGVPPPPPSRRARLSAWLRRKDRAGHGWRLVAAGAVIGGVVGLLVATLVGVWLQPRFTVLEVAAQRLAPEGLEAQPPVEEVAEYAAFDRHYTVEFPTPAGRLSTIVNHARRQRWEILDGPEAGEVALERRGVRADVVVATDTTRVETRVATWVRVRQRQARWLALLGGAVAGGVWVRREISRRPRLIVHDAGSRH